MSDKNSVVAIFDSHERAEDAIRELQKDGFDMKKLSIVGKDYHTEENVVGYYNTGDRMKYWGKLGGFWGGFWGLLFGSAFFWLPGIGPVLVGGPLVVWIVGALEERRGDGRTQRLGRRTVQHRHPEEQYPAIRNPGEERQTPPGRPWNARGSGSARTSWIRLRRIQRRSMANNWPPLARSSTQMGVTKGSGRHPTGTFSPKPVLRRWQEERSELRGTLQSAARHHCQA